MLTDKPTSKVKQTQFFILKQFLGKIQYLNE